MLTIFVDMSTIFVYINKEKNPAFLRGWIFRGAGPDSLHYLSFEYRPSRGQAPLKPANYSVLRGIGVTSSWSRILSLLDSFCFIC